MSLRPLCVVSRFCVLNGYICYKNLGQSHEYPVLGQKNKISVLILSVQNRTNHTWVCVITSSADCEGPYAAEIYDTLGKLVGTCQCMQTWRRIIQRQPCLRLSWVYFKHRQPWRLKKSLLKPAASSHHPPSTHQNKVYLVQLISVHYIL